MITKRTDKKVRRAQSEIASALIGNKLKGYEELPLRGILNKLNKWIEDYGRPEERGK